jgi:hypothetical protein
MQNETSPDSSEPLNARLPRPPRKLTDFVSHEFLYEYTQGALDDERKAALENQIANNPPLRSELKTILTASAYAESLAKTRISPLHLEELAKIKPVLEVLGEKLTWQKWPEPMRWAAEALAISTVIAVIAISIPWEKVDLQFPERVARLARDVKPALPPPAETPPVVAEAKPPPPAMVAKAPVEVRPPLEAKTPEKIESKTPAPIEASKTVVAQAPPAVTAQAPPAPVAAPVQKTPAVTPGKGELYSMMMSFPISDNVAIQIRDRILSDGGAKAGQVELAWRKKGPAGRYYHFTIPEKKYQRFVNFLGKFGPVRIYKSPHPRVMPEGQQRVILWIEDTQPGVKAEGASGRNEQAPSPGPSDAEAQGQ